MQVSVEYVRLLSDEQPGALILLAHYCLMLKRIESQWYFEGRATKKLISIVKLRLDSRWHRYLEMPLEGVSNSAG